MTSTRPFSELAERAKADPARQARVEEYRRAIDDSLALARLRDGVETYAPDDGVVDLFAPDSPGSDQEEDPYLAALRGYVADLGGRLVLEAVFPDRRVNLLRPLHDASRPDDHDDPSAVSVSRPGSTGAGSAAADGVDDLDPVAGRERS